MIETLEDAFEEHLDGTPKRPTPEEIVVVESSPSQEVVSMAKAASLPPGHHE